MGESFFLSLRVPILACFKRTPFWGGPRKRRATWLFPQADPKSVPRHQSRGSPLEAECWLNRGGVVALLLRVDVFGALFEVPPFVFLVSEPG